MKHICCHLLFTCLIFAYAPAQTDTSAFQNIGVKKDSVQFIKDSTNPNDSNLVNDSSVFIDSFAVTLADSSIKKTQDNVTPDKELKSGVTKIFTGKEFLFYYLVFLLMFFGLLHMAFAKYFNDLFRVFFRTTLKQKQVREQLLQSPLPSALMNCFFVFSAGLYVNFLLQNFHLSITENFWLQYVYCMAALALIYMIKFLGLKIAGWLFNAEELTASYTFIVFIINKMLGILLLPFLVLLAFTSGTLYTASLSLSYIGVGLLYGYRFILSYSTARNEIKLNPFHFILYIIGFEIIPLLLIYKLLLIIF